MPPHVLASQIEPLPNATVTDPSGQVSKQSAHLPPAGIQGNGCVGAFFDRAADCIGEDIITHRFFECVNQQIRFLIVGRNSYVALFHNGGFSQVM